MDLNEVVGIDYYSLFTILGISFVLGFMLGKRVARMGFMFILLITAVVYFVYVSQTGQSSGFEVPQNNSANF